MNNIKSINSSYEIQVEIRSSSIKDKGVFAKTKLLKGCEIGYFDGYEIDHITKYSLNLEDKHIEPTGILQYLNHSCSPNAIFKERSLFALHDIVPGKEITVDYLATEVMILNHFQCKCGSTNCRGSI